MLSFLMIRGVWYTLFLMELLPSVKTIGIIGFGRFGRLLYSIFSKTLPEKTIKVSSQSNADDGKVFFSKEEVLKCDLLIPCVPIRFFEETIIEIAEAASSGQTVLDVCSVKVLPKRVMLSKLPKEINCVASHPMFGPATYRSLSGALKGLNVVIENVRASENCYKEVSSYFLSLGMNVVELDADEHDRLAARFQFLTLTNAMVLKRLHFTRSRIDTKSADAMIDFLEMVSIDKALLRDLYKYNPYCKEELYRYENSFEEMKRFLHSEN